MTTERHLHSLAELLAWTAGKVVADDWGEVVRFTDGSTLRVDGYISFREGSETAEHTYWVTDAPGAPPAPAADLTTDPITGVDLPPAAPPTDPRCPATYALDHHRQPRCVRDAHHVGQHLGLVDGPFDQPTLIYWRQA